MINTIKTYYIIVVTLVLAVLVYLFQRRGTSIRDLQMEHINSKMNEKLNEIRERVEKGENSYEDALKKYRALRHAYESVSRRGK